MTRKALVVAAVWMFGVATTVQIGAQSGAPASSPPTFSRDVAPILYDNCTSCHRPGEIGPMSLLSYKETRPWAKSIATRVANRTMPPWHADPHVGVFQNDRRLTDAQVDTISRWVAAGAPEGDPRDLPPAPTYTEGWAIGQPDAILPMQEDYPIPAQGTIAYQYFEVPTNFDEDKWVQAFEVRPGNRTVVHHVIVYTRPPAAAAPAAAAAAPRPPQAAGAPRQVPVFTMGAGMEIRRPDNAERPVPGPNDRPAPRNLGGSIGAYVPGNASRVYRPGTATRLVKGTTLVFQMHYTTNGTATTDRTSIGLVFAKEPPQTELRSTALVNGNFEIPPGSPNTRVDAEMTINRDVTIWGILPHTHVRGKAWSFDVTYPDGRNEKVLAVPKYDFEWQTDYVFKEPLKLPAGSKLHAIAWYDNSTANKANPDPTKTVYWGDQTWEEMMFTGITFSVDATTPPASGSAQ